MDPATVVDRADEVVLLDVREPLEWQAGHVAGAQHLPMSQLGARQAEIPTSPPIVCVCRSGHRSAFVTQALRQAGYEAHNLEGGLLAWLAADLPLVTEDGRPGTVV